jgi:hypothetical protein
VATRSDERGRASARFLLPGTYRLFASTEDGLASRCSVEIHAGRPHEMEVVLRAQ